MPNGDPQHGVSEEEISALLARESDGLLVALGPDGFRVAMPQSPLLARFRTVDVPPDRATMLDLVAPADAMKVITTWERARETGAAIGTVHLRTDPDRPMTLTIMDARSLCGVWLGLVGRATETSEVANLDPALLVPLRPRQGVVRKNFNAVITGVDERACQMLGWHPDRMIGTRSLEFLHPDDHGRAIASWMEMLARQKPSRARVRHRRGDGGWLWIETENVVVGRDETGDWLIETLISDISEEMAAYEQVRQREELFHRLAESLPTGVMQVDRDRRVVYANSRLSAILAAPAAELLADQIAHLVDADRVLLESAIDAALNAGADHDLEVEVHHPQTGDLRRCTAAVVAVAGPEGTSGALVSLDDITDAARMREELRVQATYDTLTGCLNRASIIASLDAALAPDRSGLTGVVYLDLDEFKVLNDTFGHAAGDEMLVEVAQRLRGALRDIDRVGRVGGDEFLVVCPGLAEPDQAMSIATRIREHLDRPAAVTAGMATPRTSIGLAIGTPGTPVDDLVARADAAMYQSKKQRRGEIVLA